MAAHQLTHPSADALRAFALGKLNDSSSAALMSHLDSCPDCCKQVAALSGDDFLNRLRQARGHSSTPAPANELSDASRAATPSSSRTPVTKALADVGRAQPSTNRESVPNLPPELAVNQQYEILRELGRGGMGVVYLAKNKLMDRIEVLKVISRALLDHPGAVERFLREIRSAAKLSHNNVVTAYHALQDGELLAFAMEYVQGQDLASLVKSQGPLAIVQACYYVQQAALGLQHAFEKGMVHRDIKPQNLILAREGKKHIVKILDFGLAKATREKKDDTGLTGEGKMLGTPDYIAPEQTLDAAKADIRADIYSLGCTLYYLLSGRPPFSASSVGAMLLAHQTQEAKPLNLVRPEVPEELAAVARRMMAKSPAKRYQTPLAVVQALNPFVKQGTTPTSPELSSGTPEAKPAAKIATPLIQPPAPAVDLPKQQPEPAAVWESLTEDSPAPVGSRKSGVVRKHRAATVKQRRSQKLWLIGGGIGMGVLLLVLLVMWMNGMFEGKVQVETKDGTLVIEVSEPTPEVLVDGQTVKVSWDDGGKKAEIRVPLGTHKVEVRKDGFSMVGKELTFKDGEREIFTARLLPKKSEEQLAERLPDAVEKSAVPARGPVETTKRELRRTRLRGEKPEDKRKLAKKLIEGIRGGDKIQVRYAMLELAGELASEAGDFDLAMESCNEIYKWFIVDPIHVKAEMLERGSGPLFAGAEPNVVEELTAAALSVGFEALAEDQYEDAKEMALIAKAGARALAAEHFVYQADFLEEERARASAGYSRVKQWLCEIQDRPDDPQANAEVGKFLCLVKREWERGLLKLAKCQDPELKAIAASEQKNPKAAADQFALGDLWWDAAAKAHPEESLDFRRRAKHWYLKGLALCKLPEKANVAKKLLPRIDSLPTRPVTLRIQLFDTWGRHDFRFSNDGIMHGTGWSARELRINHLRFPLAQGTHSKSNSRAFRFLPDGIDFMSTDVIREAQHPWGTLWFEFSIDFFNIVIVNPTADAGVNFDFMVTFQSSGFTLANRMSGLWDVKFYKGKENNANPSPEDWDKIVSRKPLRHDTRDRIDFCLHENIHHQKSPPLADEIPYERFAMVATSEWDMPAGEYEFHTLSDDGVRVFIDDRKVFDQWRAQKGNVAVRLNQGFHRIRIDYYQAGGPARLQFWVRKLDHR